MSLLIESLLFFLLLWLKKFHLPAIPAVGFNSCALLTNIRPFNVRDDSGGGDCEAVVVGCSDDDPLVDSIFQI